ncbi:restriction endonuclease subunit S [Ochrobactrum sp. Marseille-Q0166]|uniref:restriction endonuclease subunit S n=1 Tax=Ochrobactrum sp. Marseille-Q0166 TaxID=2761105 RepID=UPI0016567600|nr:restriction endonuclease subunit S [Ochrobactrum sp. Marseille-Q0166]MBC8716804.1 restriction endonuclease subunit S [Ochrobactrum sp. Marseille-Q0166]
MVKAGYKQTEVGEIPEDWEATPLGALLRIKHGKSQKLVESSDGDYPILATGGEIGRAKDPLYSKPSVLIGRKGTIDVPYYMDTPFWTVDTLFYSEISYRADAKFMFYKFQLIDWYKYNEASGVPSLSATTIEKIIQATPKERFEQEAIANTLSDVDALIVSLEKLIEKKRDIKTATMQQLLTGKKRLPGFGEGKGTKQSELGEIPEDWDVRKYGDTFAFLSTANNSRADLNEDGDVEYIHYGDIHTKLHFNLDLERQTLPKIDRNKLRNPAFIADGDVVMADASEDYEGIGKSIEISNVGTRRVVSGLHTFLLRDTEKRYANGFRGYLHSIPAIKCAFDTLATGLKVYGLSKNSLKSVSIPVPPFDEQVEIVKVISCMDDELHLLEEKLSKAKAIKQGMMQELLTGRTRLV